MEKVSYLTSKQVLKALEIKPQSLYAYVSRGWIKSIPDPASRGRLYLKSDVERIRLRKRARSGHAIAAASALHFGDPILETSITEILEDSIHYRTHDLFSDLAGPAVPFENVAELLWGGTLIDRPIRWTALHRSTRDRSWETAFAQARSESEPKLRMASLISRLTLLQVREPDSRADQTLILARELYRHLVALMPKTPRAPEGEGPVVETLCQSYGLKGDLPRRVINAILVVCADHELNTAAFVARAAAANGADTLLCLESAFAAFRGTQQAFQSDAVEGWNRRLSPKMSDRQIDEVLKEEFQREGRLSGFGHALYPGGDPRARFLVDLGRNLKSAPTTTLERAMHWMRKNYQTEPNLDVGLVFLTKSLGLPDGTASSLFSLARFSGWIAHILEQRALGTPIRPRAKFVRS